MVRLPLGRCKLFGQLLQLDPQLGRRSLDLGLHRPRLLGEPRVLLLVVLDELGDEEIALFGQRPRV